MTLPESKPLQSYIEWKSWDAERFGMYTIKDSVQFAAELKAAGVQLTANTAVLEIGFGNASFAGWIRETSPRYIGIEANPELVRRAINSGIEAYSNEVGLHKVASGRCFDLIVIFDVIEHLDLDEIIQMVRCCRENLSEAGKIIVRVPSGDSPFSGPLMHGDITHKTFLGSKAIAQLATITELEIVSIHDSAFPIFGLGARIAIARILVTALRKLIGKTVNAAFNGNTNAVMSNNMIAVFQHKKKMLNAKMMSKRPNFF